MSRALKLSHREVRALMASRVSAGVTPAPQLTAPITFTVPWEMLLGDNHRMMPVAQRVGVKWKARLVMSSEYRATKSALAAHFAEAWGIQRVPLTEPVHFHALVWYPDARRRDVANFHKLTTDALTGVVVADDSQIHRETWEFAGIDRAAPRAILEIAPVRGRSEGQ